jgi:hypothetical protein
MKITIKEENLESSKSFPKIRNIVVKNYRGLRSAELKDFSQVNLVFGKKITVESHLSWNLFY